MPPEPLSSWDRKDFFKERKHERPESLGGSVARWRDSSSTSSLYHHNSRPREFARWGSTELRRPPGHSSKQGGWHMFPEELGNGYAPSRSNEKIFDEEKYRLTSSRSGDGKYGRSSRENRGSSYTPKDWRSHPRDISNGSRSPAPSRYDVSTDQRPVEDMPTYFSDTHSGFANGWDKNHFKDQHDKSIRVNGMAGNKRYEQETSLGSINWKPLQWTRSGSMSSRGSGYSHSSSPRSAGVDNGEVKAELPPANLTPSQSPTGDAVGCDATATAFDESASRKKPRLGWGEGLAKYEKGPNISGITSPRVLYYSDCPSPTTPSSVACSSSPGTENKPYVQVSNTENDTSNIICSQGTELQNHPDCPSLNLENLETDTIASVGSYLMDLLKFDDQTAVGSNCVRSTALNKLLVCKSDISKALETTESEIDSLESELKSLKSEPGSSCSIPLVSSSVPVKGTMKPCDINDVASSLLPTPLELDSTGDIMVRKSPFNTRDVVHIPPEAKGEEFDSSGTATSALGKRTLSSDFVKHPKFSGGRLNDEVHDVNNENADCFASTSKPTENVDTAPLFENLGVCTDMHNASICDTIFASNRESARRASKVFNRLLGRGKCQSDTPKESNITRRQKDLFIKKCIAKRMRFFRFKERVISLKFRAFQYLWEEDIRLLSVKKNSAKSHKRLELSSRLSLGGIQKHRSSIRSRVSSPARSLSLVPTTEMINFTSELLSDPQFKLCRRTSKMPALIMDKKEKLVSRLLCSNGLIEDPLAVEKERTMINPWTPEEKKIFMDNLAVFGKDFRKIASFIDHKTTADCVEFYYKNHKSDTFEKIKKPLEIGKHGKALSANTYMLTSGKRWNREPNVASLDILGAASVIAAQADADEGLRNSGSRKYLSGCHSEDKTPKRGDATLESMENDSNSMENERETVAAADVLAGICSSLSSEAMSSCITSSLDPAEGYPDWKYKKEGSARDRPLTPEVAQMLDDDETCSDESSGDMDSSDWTDGEKSLFIQAISIHGRDFAKISHRVRTRSREQCKLFFSKARKCLGLDMLLPVPGNVGASDDPDGGGSDSEDACVVEAGSDIGSNKSDSKMEDDLHLLKKATNESDIEEGVISLQTNLNTSEEVNGLGEVDHAVSGATQTLLTDQCQLDTVRDLDFDGDNKSPDARSLSIVPTTEMTNFTSELLSDPQFKLCRQTSKMPALIMDKKEKLVSRLLCNNGLIEDPLPVEKEMTTIALAEESGVGNQTEGERTLIPLSEKLDAEEGGSADTVDQMGLSASLVTSHMNEVCPLVAKDTSACTTLTVHANSNHHVPMEVDSDQNALSISLQNSLPIETSQAKESTVQFEKNLIEDGASSTLGLEEIRRPQYRTSASVNGQLHSYLESQILSGSPDITAALKTSVDPILQMCIAQERVLKKCSTSTPHSSVTEVSHHHPRSHTRSSSDPEKPSKNGDVKLFGQILSIPSPSVTQENDEKLTHHSKSSNNSLNLKVSRHSPNIDGSKFDRSNYLGVENFAMRTYGFWDGNMIQTGLPTLPESAILRAKYSPAFNNYPPQTQPPSSSSIIEQSPLQTVLKNVNNYNGIPLLPTREAEYQMYRSLDGNKLQQLMQQQRHDVTYEKQRLNVFGGVPSLQQQGRGVVLGSAGILVSPPVSDPVAAFKMHYANAEQYGGQAEEERWRGI